MCNLYRMTKGVDEIARLFGVLPETGAQAANLGDEVYPGYPGLVVAEGHVGTMTWGFPLVLKGRQGQPLKPKPVTNARDDKLGTTFWRDSFAKRRCLVPVNAWSEPEGRSGRMTRTWYGIEGHETFAVAGLWRESEAWGRVYTMVMANASPQMVEEHDRMPVLLPPDCWEQWTKGTPDQAMALVGTSQAPLRVDRTRELWTGGGYLEPDEPADEAGDDTSPRLL